MHDVVVVGIPLIAILAGILFRRSDIKELRREPIGPQSETQGGLGSLRTEILGGSAGLRVEMRARFSEVRIKIDQIDADLRHFYQLTRKFEARVYAMEARG